MRTSKLLFIAIACLFAIISCAEDPPQAPDSTQDGVAVFGRSGSEADLIEHFRKTVESGQEEIFVPFEDDRYAAPPVHRNRPTPPELEPSIDPSSLSLTLEPGECYNVDKTVILPGSTLTRADILFCVDLTGSMGGELNQLKIEIASIVTSLAGVIDDPAFGLVSYMDYPSFYSFCGYAATYGYTGFVPCSDQPYILNQAIDTDETLTQAAVAALTLSCGADGPESYARVLYETYADAAISWRDGSRRIVVNFGDNVPHDCDIGACLSLALGTTGIDPGRDGTAGTADDLVLMDVLNGMDANNITLCHINSGAGGLTQQLWECWAAVTPNGGATQINSDGTVPGGLDLADLIFGKIEAISTKCDVLTLTPSGDFDLTGWVQNLTPASYNDAELPDTFMFNLDICVPEGTEPGTYVFDICADCDGELVVCESDTVVVPEPAPVSFDIHPTSCPNPLNVKSNGVTPAALVGSAGFEVNDIDVSTLLLEGSVAPIRSLVADVTEPVVDPEECECTTAGPDGYDDLTLKFKTQDIVAILGAVVDGDVIELTITGALLDGTPFEASDCIIIRGAGNPPKFKE